MSEFQRKGAKAQRKKLLILCAVWLFSNDPIFEQVSNETQALNAIWSGRSSVRDAVDAARRTAQEIMDRRSG